MTVVDQTLKEADISERFGRVKGASWFSSLYNKDVMVLGQGGIGSWLSFMLGRIGCNLHIFDMDIYETHNMTGQLVDSEGVGKNKAEAAKAIIERFSPGCNVSCYGRYDYNSPSSEIVLCGFDNMTARKIAFGRWVQNMRQDVQDIGANPANYFFQDGRLLAEQLQVFNIPGDKEDLIKEYEEKWLFSDGEGVEGDCTFKQTSHCAAMIACHMTGFLTNWIHGCDRRKESKEPFRRLPFLYEYAIPVGFLPS